MPKCRYTLRRPRYSPKPRFPGGIPLAQQPAKTGAMSTASTDPAVAHRKDTTTAYRLLASCPDPLVVAGQDGTIQYANRAAIQMTGWAPSDLVGRPVGDLVPEHMHKWLAETKEEVEQLGKVCCKSSQIQRQDGTILPIEVSISKVHTGQADRYLIIARATPDRIDLTEEALQAERLRALGEIASGVAHDFRNTLGAILGRAQLLLMKTSDLQMQEALKTIEKAALDGGETVRRIMRYSKGEQSGEEFVSVDINELLREVIANTRYHWHDQPEREGKRIHVETDLTTLPTCQGNPAELRQFFTNLITNACDAMPDGGRLAISTRSTPTTITVTLEDTGHGMPPEVQSRIFDSFFTTKSGGSLGLGLALGKQAVHRHGGRITLDSNVGEGTIFTVTLPRPDQPTEPIEDAQTVQSTTHTQGARILVVDDEPALCEVLCESVIALGHQVTGSSSGQHAFRMLNTQHFDVVITDLGMPDIPGSKVAEAAKQISPAPHVILLTGWDNPLDYTQSKYVDEVLTKPVSMARLSAAIETGLVA